MDQQILPYPDLQELHDTSAVEGRLLLSLSTLMLLLDPTLQFHTQKKKKKVCACYVSYALVLSVLTLQFHTPLKKKKIGFACCIRYAHLTYCVMSVRKN
jgi:hypothetical protein